MKTLKEYFKSFRLAHGGHDRPEADGKACFMNVISYLVGDQFVSDHPENVCSLIRDLIITFNDVLDHDERQQLMPFLERAINSATSDMTEINRRRELLNEFRKFCESISHMPCSTFDHTGNAFVMAIQGSKTRAVALQAALKLLDEYLPPAKSLEELDPCILVRAERLDNAYQRIYKR